MDPVSKAQQESQRSAAKLRSLSNLEPHKYKPGKDWKGNAGGRPKKKPFTEIYEELLDDPDCRKAIKKRMLATMSGKGMAGVLERREAADRIEGKVPQGVQVEGEINLTLSGRLAKARERKAKK